MDNVQGFKDPCSSTGTIRVLLAPPIGSLGLTLEMNDETGLCEVVSLDNKKDGAQGNAARLGVK